MTSYTAALKFLVQQQRPDGSFAGYAGPHTELFKTQRTQPTIFPTILITNCLLSLPDTSAICESACSYIAKQMKPQGSWNYWQSNSNATKTEPYPDDLDDTALAFAVLARHNSEWATGERAGQFTRMLVASEDKPGGPYNTWLINTKQSPQWQDIDMAVNANIAYALLIQGVMLDGLQTYFVHKLRSGKYASSYYVGNVPVLYFLSRTNAADLSELATALHQEIVDISQLNALDIALLISAACNVLSKQSNKKLLDAVPILVTRLKQLQKGDHWPAEPLYVDPVYDGQQYYGGSEALTTAFALEALHKVKVSSQISSKSADVPAKPQHTFMQQSALLYLQQDVLDLPASLRKRYMQVAQRIVLDKSSSEILGAASLVANMVTWDVAESVVQNLNQASIHGWLAYTLFDDILDGEGAVSTAPLAMLAVRRSQQNFHRALPMGYDSSLIYYTFNTMDIANDWEQRFARATVNDDNISISALPHYGAYIQLANRSWGHSLAATIVLLQKYSPQSAEVEALQSFFKHFLVARQLNDDAHDWQEDLARGHLSAVVTLLFKNKPLPLTVHFKQDLPELQKQFWTVTIDQVAKLIKRHLKQARKQLRLLEPIMDTATFNTWLVALDDATQRAIEGTRQTKEFIAAFNSDLNSKHKHNT